MVCYDGLVYLRPHFGLLSSGGAVWDEPAQYISMQAPETTVVVPNGSHYRDSQFICIYRHSRREGASKPKSVRPSQRVSEFLKELSQGLS